ncbi:hypothetical protein J3F83DRAFT_494472 [Trichoderma novae-zelandiae]
MSYCPSEAASTTASIFTPSSSELTMANLRLRDDPSDAVPWPGNTYRILEAATGRPLSAEEKDNITVIYNDKSARPETEWLCVEANGYFGFFNQKENTYLSAYDQMGKLPSTFGPDQYFIPRRHPGGGYQLLSPTKPNTLSQLAAKPNQLLLKRQHAGTVWRFVKVSAGDDSTSMY